MKIIDLYRIVFNPARRIVPLLFIFLSAITTETFGQVYGLAFKSHSFLKEERTHVDLNPEKYFVLEGKFRLSFKFRLQSGENMYFGYIFRIIDSQEKNIDLIYNHQSSTRNSFEIVTGKPAEEYSVKTDFNRLCTEWIELFLEYDDKTRELSFSAADTLMTVKDVVLGSRIKIIFGASDIIHFKTTDVPPMILRDIRFSQREKLLHEWPLDENAGNIAFDKAGKINALVENPDWLNPKHIDWLKVLGGQIPGIAETAFDSSSETIYVIGDEYMLRVSIPKNTTDTIRYRNKPEVLKAGCQAFFDQTRNVVISYNVDVRTIATFDFATELWTQTVLPAYRLTVFWHHNKVFLDEYNTLMVFGGYGQHEYKNNVIRYGILSKNWDLITPAGDIYPPRYLAALGRLKDTVYILGGYGSLTGKQINNPGSYSDFWGYVIQENRFFKKYDFKLFLDDAAFSNSLVIDQDSGLFYALTYPVFKYDSYLQLVKGSLSHPEIVPVGRQIPYKFHDIVSFCDLFLCRSSRKLACVTLVASNEGSTDFDVFTIGYPPNRINKNDVISDDIGKSSLYLMLIAILIIPALLFFGYRKKYLKREDKIYTGSGHIADNAGIPSILIQTEKRKHVNSVLFFGDFQIFNKKGEDITNRFSPLLRELFILIWFYSMNDKGISSEKIIEILWFDKDEKSARNNLAVNLTKLKHHLADLDTLELSHHTGYWKFKYDGSFLYNDYVRCLSIVTNPGPHDNINVRELIHISQEGNFLASSNHEWLDGFKASFSNAIIDFLIDFSKDLKIEDDPDLASHLAEAIMKADILNEEALRLKCKALIVQGKHALSKEAYEKFARDYQNLINIPYKVPFVDIIG